MKSGHSCFYIIIIQITILAHIYYICAFLIAFSYCLFADKKYLHPFLISGWAWTGFYDRMNCTICIIIYKVGNLKMTGSHIGIDGRKKCLE